jgi:hypothetical protein
MENIHPLKKNLIQDSEGMKIPSSRLNERKINDAKEPNETHKNTFKEEILQVITENFREMLLDMVNQNL